MPQAPRLSKNSWHTIWRFDFGSSDDTSIQRVATVLHSTQHHTQHRQDEVHSFTGIAEDSRGRCVILCDSSTSAMLAQSNALGKFEDLSIAGRKKSNTDTFVQSRSRSRPDKSPLKAHEANSPRTLDTSAFRSHSQAKMLSTLSCTTETERTSLPSELYEHSSTT